jgi:glutathione S-transferase
MKLLSSDLSPFARKVRVLILEKGLQERVAIVACNPYEATAAHLQANPLSKVPTLILEDGNSLYDSHVICEYLDTLGGPALMPMNEGRIPALKRLALTDGLLQSTFSIACELHRREAHERSMKWVARWVESIERSVDALAQSLSEYGDDLTLPHIGAVCALDYLDLRAADKIDWRDRQPSLVPWYTQFGERPAMVDTRPST